MVAIVFGTSGALGAALAGGLVSRTAHPVFGVSRRPAPDIAGVTPLRADTLDEDALRDVAQTASEAGAIRRVVVATGMLSDGDKLRPEKSYRQVSRDAFEALFAANTIGPALIAKHLIPVMPRKGPAQFAALSARVGSISDNRLGGWHAYRASKAALNMTIRNIAIEQARRNAEFIAVGLHPGTVDSPLSKPFQSNVPPNKLFSASFSAERLLDVLEQLTPDQSGNVYDYAGTLVPA